MRPVDFTNQRNGSGQKMTLHSIEYRTTTIEYELSYARRKTLVITVHPDKRVTVRVPEETSLTDVEDVVRKKGGWIVNKQQEFETYLPALPPPTKSKPNYPPTAVSPKPTSPSYKKSAYSA